MIRFLGLLCCLSFLASGCAVVRLPLGGGGAPQEVTLMGEGADKVLLVDVTGLISFSRPWALPGFPQGDSLPERLRADLDRARKDSHVKALLVRIDSPGGTVSASDVLFHEIRLFREERGVPVVALILEKGLSGGYYTALAADEIVALPTALVGSVGVFVAKFDASGLLERWGVRSEITKSGPQKDLLSFFRPLTSEEQETLAEIVDELQGRFLQTVRAARPRARDADLEAMASAAPFTARRALELNMIDRVGYVEDAFRSALTLAGVSEGRLVAYRTGSPQGSNPYSLAALTASLQSGPLFLDRFWVAELFQGEVCY